MVTAGSSFNHIVQNEHDGNQVLVTHGIYSTFRHPAYFGWFWWSVGSAAAPSPASDLDNGAGSVAQCSTLAMLMVVAAMWAGN